MPSRLCAVGLTRRSLSDQEDFVYSEFTQSGAVLSKKLASILSMCTAWHTPGDHAKRIVKNLRLDPVHAEGVEALLADFAAQKLVISEDSVQSSFGEAASCSGNTNARITTLVITSRNRPDDLIRCVESYAANCRDFERAVDIVVFDDSDEAEVRRRTLDALFATTYPSIIKLFYYGPEQKNELARQLATAAGCRFEVVQFATCGAPPPTFAAGAAHNAALLTTCGEMFVTVDDDTICDVGPIPGSLPGIRLSSDPDPTEWWFVATRDEANQLAPRKPLDVIAQYERFLGKSVASLLSQECNVDMGSAACTLFQGVIESEASVGICAMGIKGDCALVVPNLYLSLEGSSYERLASSEATYRDAFTSREVLRGATQTTISNTATCLTNNLGIDNRRLLPPFLPRQYGDDILFGLLVNLCRKDTFSAHLPLAMLHDADRGRTFYPEPATHWIPGTQASHLIAMLAERFFLHFQSLSPEENLSALGRYFQLLGSENQEHFRRFVTRVWVSRTTLSIAMLRQRIVTYQVTAPRFWIADLETHVDVLKTALLEANPVPRDLARDGDHPKIIWVLFQELLFAYGQLLEAWQGLTEAARKLNVVPHRCAIHINPLVTSGVPV
jgi:hypothetical protein